jgi:hypothetical protein
MSSYQQNQQRAKSANRFKNINITQADSGGKVNILGGDGIGHCEKESSYKHVSNPEWLPKLSCLNLQTQKHCEW